MGRQFGSLDGDIHDLEIPDHPDRGCKWHPSCLSCPLPECAHILAPKSLWRNSVAALAVLADGGSYTAAEISGRSGYSKDSVRSALIEVNRIWDPAAVLIEPGDRWNPSKYTLNLRVLEAMR